MQLINIDKLFQLDSLIRYFQYIKTNL